MREIGGFLDLSANNCSRQIHPKAYRLNTARNSLELFVLSKGIQKIHLPEFICPVIYEPLKKWKIETSTYQLNGQLEIADDFDPVDRALVLYCNYFGIRDQYINTLTNLYPNLIIDNSQSFYYSPKDGQSSFNSARKFLGVPDGAFLYSDIDIDLSNIPTNVSTDRFSHLISRIDNGSESSLSEFHQNEEKLCHQEISRMSKLSELLISSSDHEEIKKKRKVNFQYLHKALKDQNLLDINPNNIASPLCYPFKLKGDGSMLKKHFHTNKIFVPTYWPEFLEKRFASSVSQGYANNIIALPIDQRYAIDDMQRILEVFHKFSSI